MPKILIVIDPEETRHSALNRIKELPVDNTEFKIDYYLSAPSSAEDASDYPRKFEEKRIWLDDLIAPYQKMGYKIETQVLVFNRLYETIIQSALEFTADYIFKPLRQHGLLKRALFTSTDWNLIRFCPCPMLLVSHANSLSGSPVLAALDLASQDTAHQNLNEVILEQTKLLAAILNSPMHLAHAYNVVTIPAGSAAGDPLSSQVSKGRRDEQFDRAFEIANEACIPRKNIHLGEGTADQFVNKCASEISAGVIVMGTVARSGVSGLFIGNTAETVMEQARCDVFVVKQADFESPIKARTAS